MSDNLTSVVTRANSLTSLREGLYEVGGEDDSRPLDDIPMLRAVDAVDRLAEHAADQRNVDDSNVQRSLDEFPEEVRDTIETLYTDACAALRNNEHTNIDYEV